MQGHTYSSTDKRVGPGLKTVRSVSQSSYLALHGHCGELHSGKVGCEGAQFLHLLGPPVLAAGLPQPEEATENPFRVRETSSSSQSTSFHNPEPTGSQGTGGVKDTGKE